MARRALVERGMPQTRPIVLIVEDDCLLLLDARMALEDAGYDVIEAADATSALATFDRRPDIAAVISDVRMPGALDGVGLASAIRTRCPGIPMILTSGDGHTISAPDGVRVIAKPYRSTTLASYLGVPVAA